MFDLPYMAPCTPSPNPHSNLEIHELEDWIGNRFPYDSIPSDVEIVPASNLLNPSSSSVSFSIPLNSSGDQGRGSNTEEQVLAQSRSKFLQVLGYHYDRHCLGGAQIFIPTTCFYQALKDATGKSVHFCGKLCQEKEYDELTTERLVERLEKFVKDATVKIWKQNKNNLLRYLERNKKNELEKFVDLMALRYKFLHQTSPVNIPDTDYIDHYNSKTMDQDIKASILNSVEQWNSIKTAVLREDEQQGVGFERIEYKDDVESALNAYKVQILAANEKKVEGYLQRSLVEKFEKCKKNIDEAINTAKYLDEIGNNDFDSYVRDFKINFEQELNAMVVEHIDSNKQNLTKATFKVQLQLMGGQLKEHGVHLLQTEIDKANDGLHADFNNDLNEFLRKLQEKHRLSKAHLIYEQHISRALNSAKLQVKRNLEEMAAENDSDEENVGLGTSSREPMSISASNLNNVSRQSGNINGALTEERKPIIPQDLDCDSGDTVILSPRAKRFRKQKSSGEKGTTIK